MKDFPIIIIRIHIPSWHSSSLSLQQSWAWQCWWQRQAPSLQVSLLFCPHLPMQDEGDSCTSPCQQSSIFSMYSKVLAKCFSSERYFSFLAPFPGPWRPLGDIEPCLPDTWRNVGGSLAHTVLLWQQGHRVHSQVTEVTTAHSGCYVELEGLVDRQ